MKQTLTGLAFVLTFVTFGVTSGCVIAAPSEGYYDHDHHRYYHEHTWHECGYSDEHCH